MRIKITAILSLLFLFFSCKHSEQLPPQSNQYAEGFTVVEHATYQELVVLNPFNHYQTVLERYYLIKEDTISTPDNGIRLKVPITNIGISSATHAGFLKELDAINIVSATTHPKDIFTPLPENAKIISDGMQIHTERTIRSGISALMLSLYNENDKQTQLFRQAGLTLLYNHEWYEQTPLARAEWIKYFGALLDKQTEADSIFEQVKHDYLKYQQLVKDSVRRKKSILTGSSFMGTWYLPTSATYMGRLLIDAGATFYNDKNTTNASLPFTFEKVLLHYKDADVWLGCEAKDKQQLLEKDERNAWFKAYKNNQTYNFYKRRTTYTNEDGGTIVGGNDFWETGVAHPELVLCDIIKVLYPNLLPEYELFFTEKLD